MKRIFMGAIAAAGITMAVLALAQEPVENISPERHGNLAAAQELVRQAYDRMTQAQEANEYDLGGHAARAKDLLRQANEEIKQAAIAANHRR